MVENWTTLFPSVILNCYKWRCELYKERKMIVVDSCDNCPFIGKCKPWKDLTKTQRMQLALGSGVEKFILNGCPLPDGEDNAEPFGDL